MGRGFINLKQITMKKHYEVRAEKGQWMVYHIADNKSITTLISEESIANEICEDFNAMENKDYRPIGGPPPINLN